MDRSGFSLIEMAIVLTIIGVIAGFSMPALLKFQQQKQFELTRQRQHDIFLSLASYLLVNKTMPCPADPAKTDSSFGSARLMCVAPAAQLIGIVPFQTLGLPEAAAKDGFGNYFTYAVDREVCNQEFGLFETQDSGGVDPQYCACKGGRGSNRLIVQNSQGVSMFAQDQDPKTEREEDFVVAVLISYGPSGAGSFTKGGNRRPASELSVDEQTNIDSTLVFVDRPYSVLQQAPLRQMVKWVSHKNLAALYARSPCRIE